MDDGDYLLGTGDDEIERLGLQHSVWRPHAARTWNSSGFRQGQTIIDVGCGPGFASLDLADVVGRSAEETWLAFARAEALPGARMITPSVLEIIARAV